MRIVALGLLALLSLGAGAAQAAPVAAPVVAEPLAEKDGLKVSIGSIELRPSDPHINVVLQNTSSKPIIIYDDWNSYGFWNLALEITSIDGKILDKPLFVQRTRHMAWSRNGPTTESISPGAAIVREVRLHLPDQKLRPHGQFYWDFPFPSESSFREVSMRAVFANDDNQSGGGKVWTGRIASPWKDYKLYWEAG